MICGCFRSGTLDQTCLKVEISDGDVVIDAGIAGCSAVFNRHPESIVDCVLAGRDELTWRSPATRFSVC